MLLDNYQCSGRTLFAGNCPFGCYNRNKQSVDHIFRKCWNCYRSCCHPETKPIFTLLQFGSGKVVTSHPMRKRSGVNADGHRITGQRQTKVLQLRHASLCVTSVVNSLKVRHAIPLGFLEWYLNDLTPATWKAFLSTEGWPKSPLGNRGELMLSRPAAAVPQRTA
jgi:hypothetical protein